MLAIRLQRRGTHKKPFYRIVINEKTKTPRSNVLEILGHYNPHTKDLVAKDDRIKYWLSVGAQMSATVNNLLVTKKIIKADKVKSWAPKKKELTEEEKKALEKAKEKPTEEKKEETKTEEPKEDKKEEKVEDSETKK